MKSMWIVVGIVATATVSGGLVAEFKNYTNDLYQSGYADGYEMCLEEGEQ